jgi:hypothetical protein
MIYTLDVMMYYTVCTVLIVIFSDINVLVGCRLQHYCQVSYDSVASFNFEGKFTVILEDGSVTSPPDL